jgi:hypothetical protein
MMTVDHIQADIRKMKKFVCERIPPDRIRIVLADGPDGPAWLDLTPLCDEDGECDLVIESNEPDAFRLRDVYEQFRRREMTGWEWGRELAADMNRWKVHELERVMAVLREKPDRPDSDAESERVGEYELPREVSTAEAASILGISKDTVLELKKAGLLEYRNTGSPDSCRPVYAFSLRSVLEVRTTYQRDVPPYHRPEAPHRHQVKGKRKYKHFTLSDD